MKMISCFRGQQVSTCTCALCKFPRNAPASGNATVHYLLQDADEPQVQRLREALRAREQCIDRQEEELRTCRQRISNLEVSLALLFPCNLVECLTNDEHLTSNYALFAGIDAAAGLYEALAATVQQQQVQHATAADAQHRQLHAFDLALLEQAEELAALQALMGAPAKKRQSITSQRRVTPGGPAPNTPLPSYAYGKQDDVAGLEANALVSIPETDVKQANPGKQPPLWGRGVEAGHGAELIVQTGAPKSSPFSSPEQWIYLLFTCV
ncbi:TPA: hypothetical protein ACH3X1_008590 [Trebouxia sp. C0004]